LQVCRFAIGYRRSSWLQVKPLSVLVLRVMDPLTAEDEVKVRDFADRHAIQFWLQPKGPDTAYPFHPLDAPELAYSLPEFNLMEMPFRPTEFTQVNHGINRMLIRRAMRMLDVQSGRADRRFFLWTWAISACRLRVAALG
jgi:23S rRNA (uracil1939-C5)-methyltransferase